MSGFVLDSFRASARRRRLGGALGGLLVLLWLGARSVRGESERPATFVLALDAGHGGSVLGAEGRPGLYEKRVTLDIARRIQEQLPSEKGVRVVMCRERDVLVPIRARVRCANQARAQLFMSIHANTSPYGSSRGTQRGFELYLSPVENVDEDAAAAARKAGGRLNLAEAAWAAHHIRSVASDALSAARRIEWRLADVLGRDRDRGIKQQGASLDVLQGLEVPGVLVEVGFLDHPTEGEELASEAGRTRIASALAEAVLDVRARERRGQSDPAISGHGRADHRTPASDKP